MPGRDGSATPHVYLPHTSEYETLYPIRYLVSGIGYRVSRPGEMACQLTYKRIRGDRQLEHRHLIEGGKPFPVTRLPIVGNRNTPEYSL